MDELEARLRQAIRARRLLSSGDRVLVGVSGGPDSVTLLHLFASARSLLRIWLGVVHVDHRLRPDSSEDAVFVEKLARSLTLPCLTLVRDVPALLRPAQSVEDAARHARYDAFQEAAAQTSASVLALAHTADDQAETVLMRLLRGAGLTGLAAIPPTRVMGSITVIRPLLDVPRSDILAYLGRHQLPSRQDAMNLDPKFVRARIRTQLLPLLERDYNPNIKTLLTQVAEQSRCDAAYLHAEAVRRWKRLAKSRPDGLALRMSILLSQSEALQRQLIRLAIERLQGDVTGFEFRHWREIEQLLAARPIGTILNLPGALTVEREAAWIVLRRSDNRLKPAAPAARARRVPATFPS